jgi:hypothetical protein
MCVYMPHVRPGSVWIAKRPAPHTSTGVEVIRHGPVSTPPWLQAALQAAHMHMQAAPKRAAATPQAWQCIAGACHAPPISHAMRAARGWCCMFAGRLMTGMKCMCAAWHDCIGNHNTIRSMCVHRHAARCEGKTALLNARDLSMLAPNAANHSSSCQPQPLVPRLVPAHWQHDAHRAARSLVGLGGLRRGLADHNKLGRRGRQRLILCWPVPPVGRRILQRAPPPCVHGVVTQSII